MDIKLILSSAVISAVISGCVAVLNFRRQNNLQYITGERKEWREEIRKIAQGLHGASYKETLELLVRLKVRINAFGNKGIKTSYMYDAHIWKVIAEIEKEKCSKELLQLKQKQLIEYLALLLKFDWERSKKEVQGNIQSIIGWGLCIMSAIYMGIMLVFENEDINVNSVVGDIVLHMSVIAGLYLVVYGVIPWRGVVGNIGKNPKQNSTMLMIIGYMICMVPSMVCIFVDWINTEIILEKYKNNIDSSSCMFVIIVFVVGMVILYFVQTLNLDNKIWYVDSINTLRRVYEKKTRKMEKRELLNKKSNKDISQKELLIYFVK